jgi:hypothetical protein
VKLRSMHALKVMLVATSSSYCALSVVPSHKKNCLYGNNLDEIYLYGQDRLSGTIYMCLSTRMCMRMCMCMCTAMYLSMCMCMHVYVCVVTERKGGQRAPSKDHNANRTSLWRLHLFIIAQAGTKHSKRTPA